MDAAGARALQERIEQEATNPDEQAFLRGTLQPIDGGNIQVSSVGLVD